MQWQGNLFLVIINFTPRFEIQACLFLCQSIVLKNIFLSKALIPRSFCMQLKPAFAFYRFLTSVTYSLPFALMAAWVLFIADFVKTLVQEKDLRLYEVRGNFLGRAKL